MHASFCLPKGCRGVTQRENGWKKTTTKLSRALKMSMKTTIKIIIIIITKTIREITSRTTPYPSRLVTMNTCRFDNSTRCFYELFLMLSVLAPVLL